MSRLSPLRAAASALLSNAPADLADDGLPVSRLLHETLQERAYQELRKAIREGRFTSGEMLTTRGLAAMLGVSPMPVREAVRRLAQEKTLEILPNRTTRVPLRPRSVSTNWRMCGPRWKAMPPRARRNE